MVRGFERVPKFLHVCIFMHMCIYIYTRIVLILGYVEPRAIQPPKTSDCQCPGYFAEEG